VLLLTMAILGSLISKLELKLSCVYRMEAPVALSYFTAVLETGHGNKLVPWEEYVLCIQHYAKLTTVKQLG